MPYGRGDQSGTPVPPGADAGRTVVGQQQFWNGLSGTQRIDDPAIFLQNGAVTVGSGVYNEPSVISEALWFQLSGNNAGDFIEQTLQTFDGGSHYVASIYVIAAGGTPSDVCRLQADCGGSITTLDFNPLNGIIVNSTNATQTKVTVFTIEGRTICRAVVVVTAPPLTFPNIFRFFPSIPPSGGTDVRVQAPQLAVFRSMGLTTEQVIDCAYIQSNVGNGIPGNGYGVSLTGHVPTVQRAPDGIVELEVSADLGMDWLGKLVRPVQPGLTVNLRVPNDFSGGLPALPIGWYCDFDTATPGTQAFQLAVTAGPTNTVYMQGGSTFTGPTTINFPLDPQSGVSRLIYLGSMAGVTSYEWLLVPADRFNNAVFNTAGAFVFFWPLGKDTVYVSGSGAGGGGGDFNPPRAGGGGGAGESVLDFAVTGGSGVVLVTIGAGGAAGAGGGDGGTGGITTLGALLTLAGGLGGTGANIGGPYSPGGVAGGAGGQNGSFAFFDGAGNQLPGEGGSNIGGGIGGRVSNTLVGLGAFSAARLGGGGSGGESVAPNSPQPGADGFIIIQW